MSIKLTLGELYDSHEAWIRLGSQVVPSVETRYRLIRLAVAIKREKEIFDKTHTEILKKFGKSLGNGNWKIRPESLEEFETEFQTLRGISIELPGTKFSYSSLESLNLSPIDIANMSWLIDFLIEDSEVKEG